jgi:hypothetical protein
MKLIIIFFLSYRDLEKNDRLGGGGGGRERSIDSRASSVSRRDDQPRAAHNSNKKSRDEYDEELRRFQSDRGKFEDAADRCFTPPHTNRGGGRGTTAAAAASQPPLHSLPPLSRSPSPPSSRRGRSPHSRGSGYDGGGGGHRNFSDRDSVVSDGSRQGSPSRDSSYRGSSSSSRYKPRTQVISPPPSGGGTDSRHGSPADLDDYESRRNRRFRDNTNCGEAGGSSSSDYHRRRGSGDRSSRPPPPLPPHPPSDPRIIMEESSKKPYHKLVAAVDSGLSEDTSSGSTGSVPDVDNAKLTARVSVPPRRISTDSAVSRSSSSHQTTGGGPDSLPPSPYTGGGGGPASAVAATSSNLLRVVSGGGGPPETETTAAAASFAAASARFGAPRTPSSPPEEADSDSSRPGTPLCDENPENLLMMARPAAGPVRLASHLRTSSTSEPMSLPLPM